ncbi:MAG: ArsR family transcriptional regulator [Halodesulfurarchaeum sp.]
MTDEGDTPLGPKEEEEDAPVGPKEGEKDAPLGPDEAFSLVADETRFGILRELWEATNGDDGAVSFSDLWDRSAVDDSGRFNYHLDKLTPRFVRQTESGYRLTFAGERVIGAAISGVYTESDVRTVDPLEVGDCPACNGPIEASYEGGQIVIQCADCDLLITHVQAPPVLAAGHEPADLPAVFSRRVVTTNQEIARGFCLLCGGRMESTVEPGYFEAADTGQNQVGVTYTCRACGTEIRSIVGAALLDHPAVISFLYEHGIDLRETFFWDLDWLFEEHATVIEEDPLRVAVRIEMDDDELRLTVDEEATVLEVTGGETH